MLIIVAVVIGWALIVLAAHIAVVVIILVLPREGLNKSTDSALER